MALTADELPIWQVAVENARIGFASSAKALVLACTESHMVCESLYDDFVTSTRRSLQELAERVAEEILAPIEQAMKSVSAPGDSVSATIALNRLPQWRQDVAAALTGSHSLMDTIRTLNDLSRSHVMTTSDDPEYQRGYNSENEPDDEVLIDVLEAETALKDLEDICGPLLRVQAGLQLLESHLHQKQNLEIQVRHIDNA